MDFQRQEFDWNKFQVKAFTKVGGGIVGFLNKHRGDAITDDYGQTINPGDFYVFCWHEKIDTGIYGVNYAIYQDSITLAPEDECL